jgi:Mce-associated membrane protein
MTVEELDARDSAAAEKVSTDPAKVDAAEEDPAQPAASDEVDDKKSARRLRLSITLRSLVISAVIVALVGAAGVLGWLYVGAQHKLDVQARESADSKRAEQIALDYAVSAAEINAGDLNAWKVKLVDGTSPQLKDKLTKAAGEMEQIFVPLQWSSTAHPLAAKVRSETSGVYVVDCFVGVLTKTVQAPEPLQSTATYSITIDSSQNWQITDVGGIGAVVEPK